MNDKIKMKHSAKETKKYIEDFANKISQYFSAEKSTGKLIGDHLNKDPSGEKNFEYLNSRTVFRNIMLLSSKITILEYE